MAVEPTYPNFYSHYWPAERNPRGRPSGGLCVLTKPHLHAAIIAATNSYVVVRTRFADISLFYFPPDTPMETIFQEIAEAIAEMADSKTWIIAGDFNCRLDHGTRGKELVTHLNETHMLTCLNDGSPTYHCPNGSSCIDLVFTNNRRGQHSRMSVKRVVERKHSWVTTTCYSRNSTETAGGEPVKQKRLTRKLDVQRLNDNFERSSVKLASEDINVATNTLTTAIAAAVLPKKHPRRIHKPWFDAECRAARTTLRNLQLRNDNRFWSYKREYRRLLKERRNDFEERELESKLERAETTPWNLFRKRTATYSSPIELTKWIEHFSAIFDPDRLPPEIKLPESHETDCTTPGWTNDPISEFEVTTAIDKLKEGKAPGPDEITNELLKTSRDLISPVLTTLFNKCLTQESLPNSWRHSVVKTLYKGSGEVTDPNNYRGITLQNALYKVLTSILNARITRRIDHQLPDQQFGFRRGKSTSQAINILTDKIQENLSKRTPLYAVFVDFRKAFPSVDRSLLIPKLAKLGVRGRVLGLIASCLRYNKLVVTDGLRQTNDINQHRGLPEGDTLAPTEYLAFAKDLADDLEATKGSEFLMFADDLVIYSRKLSDVQRALDALEKWCKENRVTVNTRKTKAMKFRGGGRLCLTDMLTYNGNALEFVNEYTYLGITLQTSMKSFSKHVIQKKKKALSAISALKYLPLTSLSTAKKIFQSKIRPIAEYSLKGIAKYMTTANLLQLDKIKSAFYKKALGLHASVSSTFALALCSEKQYSEQLIDENYDFRSEVIDAYNDNIEDRFLACTAKKFTDGPAFQRNDWMERNRKDRHLTTRATFHGFHHLLCMTSCYDPAALREDSTCTCRICQTHNIDRYHLLACPGLRGSLKDIVKFLQASAN